jgi:membrane fusion protein (multidrug efflux system)
MATTFSRTLRSLRADRSTRASLALAVGTLVLGAWTAWMLGARVPVYEATPTARLEVEQAAHPIQAPTGGRIESIAMHLGAEVAVGDVLAELDVSTQRLDLEQAKAHLAAIGPELVAAKRELAADEQAAVDVGQGAEATVAEARAKLAESEVALRLADEQVRRAEHLQSEGIMSKADLERAKADAESKRAIVEANRIAIGRIGATGRADTSDRRARREALARQIASLEGDELTTRAEMGRLENEVARRVVRATVAGKIAEVSTVTPGSVVREGDRLGAVVPSGDLRIVAEFPPPRALGRIRVGQPARMRLEGFPWAQHGMVPARVSHVASEVRNGRIRVELEVLPSDIDVPLQHGLPGSLEVEVERTSPALLVLRAAGKAIEGSPEARSPDGATSAAPSAGEAAP